jgi:acetoacetate decarboxylase
LRGKSGDPLPQLGEKGSLQGLISSVHPIADLTLELGEVVHDYLA